MKSSKREILRKFAPRPIANALIRLWTHVEPNGSQPFQPRYEAAKTRELGRVLGQADLIDLFRRHAELPNRYGFRFDERIVEYPWLISRLPNHGQALLDAGSILNHGFIIDHPNLTKYPTRHIVTLSPEYECYWARGVSYLFHDLRDLPLRDAVYDTVICISTLEHIGADNAAYTRGSTGTDRDLRSHLQAIREMKRVLKPGGTLLFTVPFGRYQDMGWQQQFDLTLLDEAIETFAPKTVERSFYRYWTGIGWQVSRAEDCASCHYAPWGDHGLFGYQVTPVSEPVAAEAIACVALTR